MKKLTLSLCMLFCVMTLHARAIQEEYRIAEEKARISYAFGMVIGSNFNLGSLGLEFDYDALAEGIRATLEDGVVPQFTSREAMEIVETALDNAMERQAEQNRLMEEIYLITNSQQPGIQFTPSGLQYIVINETDGEKPEPDSVVRVNYIGSFMDGRIFDTSGEEGGAYIPLEMVIPGWAEGLMLMSVGSTYRLFIPSNLAYGKDGIQGFIPPYSPLIFMVELLEIMSEDEVPFY